MDTQDLFKKYCNFGWALWPATKTLSRYVEAVHRLYKLIAVVCCQICGPRNTQGGAGCLGMALVWIICGLGRAEFQQETRWSHSILSFQYQLRITASSGSTGSCKSHRSLRGLLSYMSGCRPPRSVQEILQLVLAPVVFFQVSPPKCAGCMS